MIRENAAIPTFTLPGMVHQTLAGPGEGLKRLEMWMQSMAPGAETPVHRHDCEEVIVVLSGSGTCEMNGAVHTFGPGATIVVPPNAIHRICNTGPDEMRVIAALSVAPVVVETATGQRIALPWDASA